MKNLIIKSLLFTGIYALFHFGYEVIPLPIFATSEAVWQHLKIGFFSGITLSLLELVYFTVAQHRYEWYSLALSRLVSAQLIVGVIFSLFYLYTGLFYKLPGSPMEIIIAVVITFLGSFIAYYFEDEIYHNFYGHSRLLLVTCLIFLVITSYLFIKFSNQVPYYPLFTQR